MSQQQPTPNLTVVELYPSNLRQPAATLRRIADEIDAGEYGVVHELALVLHGDAVEVFGIGPEQDGGTTHLLLHAGAAKLAMAVLGERGE